MTGRPSRLDRLLGLLMPSWQAHRYYARGDEAAAQRRWARASEWFHIARRLRPADYELMAEEADCLIQLGLYEEAIHLLAQADQLDPKGYCAWRAAEAAQAARKPTDQVLAWIKRALEKSPMLTQDLAVSSFQGLVVTADATPDLARVISR